MTSLTSPNIKVRRLSLNSALQTGSSGMNPVSSTILEWSNRELEWWTYFLKKETFFRQIGFTYTEEIAIS